MYKRGDKIKVTNDAILGNYMGIPEATGTVFSVTPDGARVIGFKCDRCG